jgi:hypothetical protein
MEAQDLNSAPELPDEYEFGVRVDSGDRGRLLAALNEPEGGDSLLLARLAELFGSRSSAVEDFRDWLRAHAIADHFGSTARRNRASIETDRYPSNFAICS